MLLTITTLSWAQGSEPLPHSAALRSRGYQLELEGIDAPMSGEGLLLETLWRPPRSARLTAGSVITAGGLVLTLLTVHSLKGGVARGDLVPGQAILTGLGSGSLPLRGGAMWLGTDFYVDRRGLEQGRGLQQGFAIRGVW